MNLPPVVQWPTPYEPGNCAVHVRNELAIAAPPDRVWPWLVRATLWPTWYVNASNVTFLQGSGPDLTEGTKFRWKTFGVTLDSTVLEFIPNERIAWDARGLGVDAYHAWVLQPTAEGCHLITEETQNGWLARLNKIFFPNRMYKFHQLWIEGLEDKARGGLPPAPSPEQS